MKSKISSYAFSRIYPMYIQKVEKKERTKEELNTVIYWLTGNDLEVFFAEAQAMEKILRN